MEYTVKELSQMAGVSARTLRYYDQIGLLRPARVNPSGYRIYGREEVDRPSRSSLPGTGGQAEQDKGNFSSTLLDAIQALQEHREKLLAKRKQLDILIANVEKTIAAKEGRINMKDQEKFEGFKQKLIAENEKKFGMEARERYGTEAVEEANRKLMKMTKEEYDRMTRLEKEMREVLAEASKGDPAGN